MFSFAPKVRQLLSTTNAIEILHRHLRTAFKKRRHFPHAASGAESA